MATLRKPRSGSRIASRTRPLRAEHLEDRCLLTTGIGVYIPASDTFSLRNTPTAGPADAGTFQFAAPGMHAVVGDWNGDGRDDFGVFDARDATWSLRYGAEAGAPNAGVFKFGKAGTLPVVGDWNGDGRDDIGTFNPVTAEWCLRYGASPGLPDVGPFQFGVRNSLPVVGDWDGDGADGIGTFKSDTGSWTLRQTADAGLANAGEFRFGPPGGAPVAGDWNNDGRDGIGVYQSNVIRWTLRQTANSGIANGGVIHFGSNGTTPLVGNWDGPTVFSNALTTLVLPPINLDLLGLEVRTSPITIAISGNQGEGKLLGNLLATVATLVDLQGASDALNNVLDGAVDLVNSADLNISGLASGPFDSAPVTATQVLELFVAPVHLDLLGAQVDTSPILVTITASTGEGKVLGNAITELINLFNPPLPEELDLDFLNTKLDELLAALEEHLPGIPSAEVPPVPIGEGQILNVTIPPLDLDLLGLELETSPITINAAAETGDGKLLGNVLTTALTTLGATPGNLSQLNTHINDVLAKVVGVLNAADLSLLTGAIDALPPALQVLLSPTLTAPAPGSTAPILDLLVASSDGVSPPVDVDLLGLVVTTSNIEAHLTATTGDGQVLGNLLYNLANLADPGGPTGLLNLFNLLGAGSQDDPGAVPGGSVTPAATAPQELLTLTLDPLDLDLLGLQVRSDPIIVTLSTQEGDGKLLGNLLTGITTLINVDGVENAINQVLATTVDLVNSVSLVVDGVGPGSFDTAPDAITPVLDLFVAPVHLDLLGLVADTSPIHLTITAVAGQGLVLGNVVTELANLFNERPEELDLDFINAELEELIDRLAEHIPSIPPAPSPPVTLDEGQFLELTVPPIDLELLGLIVQTSPITVNATAEEGNGMLLGNILTVVLNTLEATPENLTGLNENLNALLSQVVGVLNVAELVLSSDVLGTLPGILQTLALPTLIAPPEGDITEILNLVIASPTSNGPPIDVQLLGLNVTTSNIDARLLAETGEGQLLGNLLYNVANLLNPGNSLTLLTLLAQLGRLQ